MRLVCVTPFEEQATKWTPQLRERYFDMLADCTDLSCVDYQETPNAQLMAYRRIVKQSDSSFPFGVDPDSFGTFG